MAELKPLQLRARIQGFQPTLIKMLSPGLLMFKAAAQGSALPVPLGRSLSCAAAHQGKQVFPPTGKYFGKEKQKSNLVIVTEPKLCSLG